MDAKLKEKLQITKYICECLLEGKKLHLINSDLSCAPAYLGLTSKTAAAKQGMTLKRGAKPVGTWGFNLVGGSGRGGGDLYLGSKFKKAE